MFRRKYFKLPLYTSTDNYQDYIRYDKQEFEEIKERAQQNFTKINFDQDLQNNFSEFLKQPSKHPSPARKSKNEASDSSTTAATSINHTNTTKMSSHPQNKKARKSKTDVAVDSQISNKKVANSHSSSQVIDDSGDRVSNSPFPVNSTQNITANGISEVEMNAFLDHGIILDQSQIDQANLKNPAQNQHQREHQNLQHSNHHHANHHPAQYLDQDSEEKAQWRREQLEQLERQAHQMIQPKADLARTYELLGMALQHEFADVENDEIEYNLEKLNEDRIGLEVERFNFVPENLPLLGLRVGGLRLVLRLLAAENPKS